MDTDNDLFHSLIFAPSSSGHLPMSPITAPCLPLLSPTPVGSVSLKNGDSTAHFRHTMLYSSTLQLLMLASAVSTNLFALYAFSFLPSPFATVDVGDHKNLSIISEHVSLILREIKASERQLHQIEHELARYETLDSAKPSLPPELKLVLACHPLPLGRNYRFGIITMVSFVAHSCAHPVTVTLLSTFMSYRHAASCPTANPRLLSKLISKACEPIPLWAMLGWHAWAMPAQARAMPCRAWSAGQTFQAWHGPF